MHAAVGATFLLVVSINRCAVFVVTFKPPFCPQKICPVSGNCDEVLVLLKYRHENLSFCVFVILVTTSWRAPVTVKSPCDVVVPLVVKVPLTVAVPVKVGLAFGAFPSSVVCKSLPLNVSVGIVAVPLKVGLAFGAFPSSVVCKLLPLNVIVGIVAVPLQTKGELITTFRVPVPCISIEFTAPDACLLALNLIGCAVFVVMLRPLD
jgi:hypothetical protein